MMSTQDPPPWLQVMRELLRTDEGSLPDICFDFGAQELIADAYVLIQSCAVPSPKPIGHLWCEARGRDLDIHHGENPVHMFLSGEADGFHVHYETLIAPTGAQLPGISVLIYEQDVIAIDYRMGPEWTDEAIVGLFSLMEKIAALATPTRITHKSNWFDPDGTLLVEAYSQWQEQTRLAAA